MALPRNEKPERRPPCVICGKESTTHPDGETPVCAGCDGEWCAHVDELVDAGKWPVGTPEKPRWHEVWKPWLAARKRVAA